MMTILGCPEKRQKTHAQQVMEPSVAHQCQKQKKDTHHREMTLCLCCTMMELALTLKIWQNWYEMRVNGHHSASTSAGTSHKKMVLVILQGVGKSQSIFVIAIMLEGENKSSSQLYIHEVI
jgi:hypothetical protein